MDVIYKGLWFLPSSKSFPNGLISVDKDKCLEGTLTINEEGFYTLETLGNFPDVIEQPFVINGNSTDGKAITLFDCYDFKGPFNSSALVNQNKYIANYVTITKNQTKKAYFNSINEIKISKFYFNSHNFSSWLWNNNFIFDKPSKGRSGKTISIKYRIPKKDKGVEIKKDFRIRILTYPVISGHEMATTKRDISERNYVLISGKNIKIDNALEAMHKFLDFLTVAIGETQTHQEVIFFNQGIRYEYYFNSSKKGEKRKIYPPHMFFNYHMIKDRWNDILIRWFDTYENMIDIFRLFFSLCNNRVIYLEQKFLFLVQFLESFHRKINPVNEEKINDWKELLEKSFSNEISKDEIKDLKGKLKYGYEPSLEARLNDLFKSSNITKKILNEKKYTIFSKKVSETRNYRTHLGTKTENVIDDSKELLKVCNILDRLARYNILKIMGFTDEQVAEIMKLHLWVG